MTTTIVDISKERRRGRGAIGNVTGRYETEQREAIDDGWSSAQAMDAFTTSVRPEIAKSILSKNDSPDISFDRSINPYRGCEHGCIYCYARPTHAYLGHSAGLDFETQIYAKTNAAELLEGAFSTPGYRSETIALGAVTDPYQPAEKTWRVTRSVLEVLDRANHPVGIVTKSDAVVRDLDILSRMAQRRLVKVALSITTLDRSVSRKMEPRAVTPAKRLMAVQKLREAGVPVMVMVAPIVPGLTDHEIESILKASSQAGADNAGYVLLRLPLEIKLLFREWLEENFPNRAGRVISLLQSMHGGQDYRAAFGLRQRGSGPFADLIARRFRNARATFGLDRPHLPLRNDLFVPPRGTGAQLALL